MKKKDRDLAGRQRFRLILSGSKYGFTQLVDSDIILWSIEALRTVSWKHLNVSFDCTEVTILPKFWNMAHSYL